jgi:tetratricopeptide (TPR) repeat protein
LIPVGRMTVVIPRPTFGSKFFAFAAVLVLAVAPAAFGKQISLEDGNITFEAPNDFTPIAGAEIEKRYPTQGNTLTAVGSDDRAAIISYVLRPAILRPDQMDTLKGELAMRMFKETPNIQWIKDDFIDLSGTRAVYCEFISHDDRGDVHNLEVYASYHGLMFIISFNATVSVYDTYKDRLWASLHSLKINGGLNSGTAGAVPSLSVGEEVARGNMAGRSGDLDRARRAFTEALRLQPDSSAALLGLGLVDYDLENYQDAVKAFSTAIAANPNFEEAFVHRGLAEGELGDFDAATKDMDQALTLNPNMAMAYSARAYIDEQRDDYEHSVADNTKSLALLSNNSAALHGRGWVEFLQGNRPKAIADIRAALELNHSNRSAEFDLACIALVADKTDAAERYLQALVDSGAQSGSIQAAHFLLWSLKTRAGHGDEATVELSDYLKDDSARKDALNKNIGAFLLDRETEADLELYAHDDNPFRDRVRHNRIWYYVGLKDQARGDTASATEAFEKCVACKLNYTDYTRLAEAELSPGINGLTPYLPGGQWFGLVVLGVLIFFSFFCALLVGVVGLIIYTQTRRPPPVLSGPPPPPINLPPPMK